ncbi:MAG: T9SS type A sorting domain-containing protein [Saprospiraceae bacterium]|nr:T9SS type A sorting domain-containing protein [Saprospiraceae bacterium]
MRFRHILVSCIFWVCSAYMVMGQSCLPAGITFSSQAQINAFAANYPGCSQIIGGVTINDAVSGNITNLNGLSGITSIGGPLYINSNDALTSITGLSNLTSVGGYLNITSNNALPNLNGLGNISSIGQSLIVGGNSLTSLGSMPGLVTINNNIEIYGSQINNISALSNLTSVGWHLIISNTALTNLSALSNLNSVGFYLTLQANSLLTDVSGLNNLAYIGEEFYCNNNNALINFNGLSALSSLRGLSFSGNTNLANIATLPNLSSLTGYLNIYNNAALANLNGLSSLISIGSFVDIEYNNALSSLLGLTNLATVAGNLTIQNNASLASCHAQGICDYINAPPGSINISGNAVGCNSASQVQTACLAAMPVTFTEFSVVHKQGDNMISWQTASEVNNDFFEIQYSRDGLNFVSIGHLSGKGTHSTLTDYHFVHPECGAGLYYYRIKQVDYDGSYAYSDIESLRVGEDESRVLNVFPNPTSGSVFIEGLGNDGGEVMVSDVYGRLVFSQEYSGGVLDLGFLTPGSYVLHVVNSSQNYYAKVVME